MKRIFVVVSSKGESILAFDNSQSANQYLWELQDSMAYWNERSKDVGLSPVTYSVQEITLLNLS